MTETSPDSASLAPIDQYRSEAQRELDQAAAVVRATGSDAQTFVLDGHTVDAVVAFAKDHAVDAIVMGSHGRTGVARLVLGSTAEGVLRHATVPVVVVRDPRDGEGREGAEAPC